MAESKESRHNKKYLPPCINSEVPVPIPAPGFEFDYKPRKILIAESNESHKKILYPSEEVDIFIPPPPISSTPPPLPPLPPMEYTYIPPPPKVIFQNTCASVFIDISNIQNAHEFDNGDILNITALAKVVENGREILSRVVVGSGNTQDEIDDVKLLWNSIDYKSFYQLRATGKGEQFVDQALQSHMCDYIFNIDSNNNTIVLVSGDGNSKDKMLSFPKVLKIAVEKYNFDVEIWSFSRSLSSTFNKLKNNFPTKVTIKFLDSHLKTLCS